MAARMLDHVGFDIRKADTNFTSLDFIKELTSGCDSLSETPVICVTMKRQDGRVAFPAFRPEQLEVASAAHHLSISLQKATGAKQTSRISNFSGGICLVLDDVGTKVLKLPSLEPTWIMETSPGNYQWGYACSTVLRDVDLFDRLIRGVCEGGLSDPGMANVIRWFRLPQSKPVGKKFVAKLAHWNPDLRYRIEDLLSGLGLKELPESRQLKPTGSVKLVEDVADPVFDWLSSEGLVQRCNGNGYWDVVCPWAEEHGDRIDEGAAYRPVGKGNAIRGFTCHHSHDHDVSDFLEWVRGNGGPDVGLVIAGKDEFERIDGIKAQAPSRSILSFQSTSQWVNSWRKPDYSVFRMRARRAAVYTITGPAGSGKSSIAACLARMIALGEDLDGEPISKQRVLYMSGENSEDDKTRVAIDLFKRGMDPSDVDIDWIGGAFSLSNRMPELVSRMENANRPYGVVIIDSSTAYFLGEDENSNTEMHGYYQKFRTLANLTYNPTIFVLAHPAKYADQQNMVPRGGGAIYATTDGNASCTLDKHGIVTLAPMKWRGSRWDPLEFELRGLSDPAFSDSAGRIVETSEAAPLSKAQAQFSRHKLDLDVLSAWVADPSLSLRRLADVLGTTFESVRTSSERLRQRGWVDLNGRRWEVTTRGRNVLFSLG